MVIKRFAFILIGIISQIFIHSAAAQGSWEKVDVPTNQFLRSVCFVDSLYGWATGDSGTILHTSDGGVSWVLQNSQTSNEIYEVFFLDRDTGWASSFNFASLPYGTWLLKTTDGGQSWTGSTYPDDNIFISCIQYSDAQDGWMGGWPHALVHTEDGGETWAQAAIDTTPLAFFPVLNIRFFNEQYGYACGGIHDIAGVIWYTWNGGDNWTPIDASFIPPDEVFQVHLFDSVSLIGAGGDPDFGYGVALMRTSDGGLNWDYEELGIIGNAFDIDFRNDLEVWCPLGPQRKLIYSLDAADTWTAIPTPDSTSIYDMIFPDSLHGWAVGKDGAVIKYTPPTQVGIHFLNSPENPGSLLKQTQPNPFTTTTRIRFTVPELWGEQPIVKVDAILTVFTALGSIVSRTIRKDIVPGEYSQDFEVVDMLPGIYYYRLEILDKQSGWSWQESKRMIRIN